MGNKTIKDALEYASSMIGTPPIGDTMAKMMIKQVIKALEEKGIADDEITFE